MDDTCISVKATSSRLKGEAEENATVVKSPDERIFIKCNPNGEPDETKVQNFVMGIIKNAVLELEAKTADIDKVKTTVIPTDQDNLSMTSSVLSELATAAVHDSLTNVVDDVKEQNMAMINDPSSLSSGAISELTTAAVHDSLTNIFDDVKEQNMAVIDDRSSLSSEAISELATAAVHNSLTNVIDDVREQSMAVTDDRSSLSSGAMSVLAEAAVTESLTRIVNAPDDENHSARKSTLTPRTVTEVLEQLDIDPSIGLYVHGELEFPPCSP